MKTKYYVLILDKDNNLTIDSIGECLDEDASLTEANKYQRKNKVNIIWTFDDNGLQSLKESLKKYEL